MINGDGVRSISPGLEPTAATILPGPNPEVTVSYVLKRPWFPGLPWWVTFRTEPRESQCHPWCWWPILARSRCRSTMGRSSPISLRDAMGLNSPSVRP